MKFNFQKVVNPPGTPLPLSIIIISAFLLFGASSCKRDLAPETKLSDQNPVVNEQNLLQVSKGYFSSLANEEKALLSQPTKKLPKNSPLRKNARIAQISELIDWEKSKVITHNNFNFLLVPFKEDRKPFKNKDFEFHRKLVFFNDSTGKLQMNIVEILGEKGTSLGNDLEELCKTSFLNSYLKQNNSIGNVNAHVMFYSSKYKEQNVFELIRGQWSLPKERFSFRSDIGIN